MGGQIVDSNGVGLGWGKLRLILREHTLIPVLSFTLVLYVLGAFAKIGLPGPLVQSFTTSQALADLSISMPLRKQEHMNILEELQITNYLLAECLRKKGDCPKLPQPIRLQRLLSSEDSQ